MSCGSFKRCSFLLSFWTWCKILFLNIWSCFKNIECCQRKHISNIQLYYEKGSDLTFRKNFVRKFTAVNFIDCRTQTLINAPEPLVVLCSFQTRIEDTCNAAMEGLQDCQSVVLVVFRRITGSVTKESIVSDLYIHPGVKETIYVGFDKNNIYFSPMDIKTLKTFLENNSDEKLLSIQNNGKDVRVWYRSNNFDGLDPNFGVNFTDKGVNALIEEKAFPEEAEVALLKE
ncbi:hypothetical protein MAR_011708 [Mya arenaria]|uniref:Uncharacterized protein n=1 Tax=Mya arenaria TaxID=6604 RepID=A0ABY7FXX2_MYAAR|nr:hypothetical protein MAR_011708 [Mya arenaria]